MDERLKEKFKIQLLVVQMRGEDFLDSRPRIGDLQYSQKDRDGPLDGASLIFTFVSQFISQSGIQNKIKFFEQVINGNQPGTKLWD